jgi:hypothetical protein
MENITARTIPPYDLGVHINGLSKRLVAFCVFERWPPHGGNMDTVAWNGWEVSMVFRSTEGKGEASRRIPRASISPRSRKTQLNIRTAVLVAHSDNASGISCLDGYVTPELSGAAARKNSHTCGGSKSRARPIRRPWIACVSNPIPAA